MLGDIIYQVIVFGGIALILGVLGYVFFKRTKKS
ncbi:LPXTG cell wall anchor domain-containing protein [Peribacillus simplex]|uniref:LPXTG cell wall anchor domain-containing protein n=1 Tax=Peribacillus simplex TaxID=1478 RepID=A0AAW7ID46_9BACI|nr:LPXTG cell wall anchor domain-containing protein [Peribacillus simplex]MDM5293015.1 LPXTG cell wall anchor domain-containing protein [Peribacillus simplex]MDM5451890.1 LPXTG cell wall anchor domain-containing protein [Peribacillus simplex]